MKKVLFILAVAFTTMSFINPIDSIGDKFKVDIENSAINWKGYKPTGSHNGTINLIEGELKIVDGKVEGGAFRVDMSTIKDADGSKKLEGHLKSPDFLDVKEYTTSKFEITDSELKDGKFLITGDMTIKGITKQIVFEATLTHSEGSITLESETFQINRADFNIKYKSKSFFNNLKEKFINDKFDLKVKIIAKK